MVPAVAALRSLLPTGDSRDSITGIAGQKRTVSYLRMPALPATVLRPHLLPAAGCRSFRPGAAWLLLIEDDPKMWVPYPPWFSRRPGMQERTVPMPRARSLERFDERGSFWSSAGSSGVSPELSEKEVQKQLCTGTDHPTHG